MAEQQRFTAGQRIRSLPAQELNDAFEAGRALRRGFGPGAAPAGFAGHTNQTGIILVKNTSGSDVERFGVLGIDAPIFTPTENLEGFKTTICLKCVTPTDASHKSKFVILREPLK